MLRWLWKFVGNGKNREILSWLGGGAAVVIASIWTGFTYLHDDRKPGSPSTTVVNPSGSIIAPAAVFNGTVNVGVDQKQIDDKIDEVKKLVQQLLTVSQAQASPGREQAVSTAVENIANGAAGDARLQQALDLLKAQKVEDAARLLRVIADDKTAQIRQDQARLKADSLDAAAAYRNLGAIAGLADPKSARDAYGRALEFDPDDREALYWHGWLQIQAGDLGSAERDLNRLLQVSVAASDDRGIFRANMRLCQVFKARGNLETARAYADDAYDIAKRHAEQSPDDSRWQYDLLVSYERIGEVQKAQGDLPEALKSYRAEFAIEDRLLKADASNTSLQRGVSVVYEKIGDALMEQGNLQEALKSYQEVLTIRSRLATSDPGNATWQRDLSVSYERIGEVQAAQGNLTEALKSYQAVFAIRDRLTKADPNNAEWQHDLCVTYSRLAAAFEQAGDKSKALETVQQGRVIVARITSLSPDNAAWKHDLAWFDWKIALLAGELNTVQQPRR
jgi:tetratricopeptide (TPR) repeat protein